MTSLRSTTETTQTGLKVVFLTITFDPEPGAQLGLPLAKWMAARGHEIKVLTAFPQYPLGETYPGYRQSLRQWERMDGIRVLRVPIYPSHDTSALRRITTYASFMASATLVGVPLVGPADVVFLYEPPPTNGVASSTLKVLRGAGIVHHIADMWPETVVESGMIRSQLARDVAEQIIGRYCGLLYRHADRVSVLSPGFKRLLVERGVPAEKVSVIYNYADESLFRPVPRDRELFDRLGLAGRFNFVYAGNLGPLQNVNALVRAAAKLAVHPEIQLIIIGTGPLEAEVKRLAEQLHVNNVRFVPRQAYHDMPKLHALADVLVVHLHDYPFLRATIPSKTQVAMACGRPILMAVRGDAADLIQAAQAGVTCEPDNPESIAQAMLSMYRMPRESLEQLGRHGRAYYESHLSLDAGGRAMEDLFFAAAASARARGPSVAARSQVDGGK